MSELAKKLKIKNKDNTTEEIKLYSTKDELGDTTEYGTLNLKVDDINCYAPLNIPTEDNVSKLTINKEDTELKVSKETLKDNRPIVARAYRNNETLLSELPDFIINSGDYIELNNSTAPTIEGYDFVMAIPNNMRIISNTNESQVEIRLYYIPESIDNRNNMNWNGYFFTSSYNDIYTQDIANTYSGIYFTDLFRESPRLIRAPKLNFSNGTLFTKAFQNCDSLETIPPYDLTNSSTCVEMFSGCTNFLGIEYYNASNSFQNINTPKLDISKTFDVSKMFQSCSSLMDASFLHSTGHEGYYTNMFNGCTSLTTLPDTLCVFNVMGNYDVEGMFFNCASLEELPEGSSFRECKSVDNLFNGCTRLRSVIGFSNSSSSIKSMNRTFRNCSSLQMGAVNGTKKVTSMQEIFYGCSSMISISDNFDTSSCTNLSGAFSGCTSLTSLPELDTSKCTNFSSMFDYCENLTIDWDIDMSSATNVYSMFCNCYKIPEVNLKNVPRNLDLSNIVLGIAETRINILNYID